MLIRCHHWKRCYAASHGNDRHRNYFSLQGAMWNRLLICKRISSDHFFLMKVIFGKAPKSCSWSTHHNIRIGGILLQGFVRFAYTHVLEQSIPSPIDTDRANGLASTVRTGFFFRSWSRIVLLKPHKDLQNIYSPLHLPADFFANRSRNFVIEDWQHAP